MSALARRLIAAGRAGVRVGPARLQAEMLEVAGREDPASYDQPVAPPLLCCDELELLPPLCCEETQPDLARWPT